ncbi:hypothetical protein EXIGLDRAFT_716059 [Exidia glandulosa HHB12029]|uniref:Uncharacterized protein n=1 Tax=Exidia glandulosa HHB12029 TaxID=1314781 RepID=A0A165QTC0_EXIGL|nr:hypothetical protein EXIGLDRAFT_716059 [Exidia glandulosa HHB12029]
MPLQLCLSVLRDAPPGERVLLLSSSLYDWREALVQLNDQFLDDACGNSNAAHLLSRIDVFHPPTRKHWKLLLSALRVISCGDPDPTSAYVLPCLPAMIVLCEPSHYFSDEDRKGADVLSDYVALITDALAASRSWPRHADGDARPSLVLFDSLLDILELPIIRQAQPHAGLQTRDQSLKPPRQEGVLRATEKYFDWICTIDTIATTPSDGAGELSDDVDGDTRYRIQMQCTRPGREDDVVDWSWTESRHHDLPTALP